MWSKLSNWEKYYLYLAVKYHRSFYRGIEVLSIEWLTDYIIRICLIYYYLLKAAPRDDITFRF